MPGTTKIQPAKDEQPETVHYASFVLRCWIGGSGRIQARLIDVQSGISHPLASLADLPQQVQHLMAPAIHSPPLPDKKA
jgi:hypothetical protein